MDSRVKEIVGRALEGKVPSYDEVVFLLGVDEASPEATYLRGTANDIAREKTGATVDSARSRNRALFSLITS